MLKYNRPNLSHSSKPFCALPWEKILVSPNGSFRNCCLQDDDLGNLLHQSWEEVWQSPKMNEIRTQVSHGIFPPVCRNRSCPLLYQKTTTCLGQKFAPYPKIVELGLPNTWCNIGGKSPSPDTACFMCPRSSPFFKPTNTETFWQVVDVLKQFAPHIHTFSPLGLSEVFWEGRLWEVLNRIGYNPYAKDILVQITSNATVFDSKTQDRYIDTVPWSGTCFSLDAATPETYKRIRRRSLGRTLNNIKKFVYHPRRNRKKQSVGVEYNINMLNVHECEEMVTTWAGVPIDGVNFAPTQAFGAIQSDPYMVNESNLDTFKEAKAKILEASEKHKVPIRFFAEIDQPLIT